MSLVSMLLLGALALGSSATAVSAQEGGIFAPYLKDECPEILEVVEKRVEDGVEITRLKFLNRQLPGGEKVIIYGVLARPAKPGKYPAILLCHGGAACADHVAPGVIDWARLGYVSFCQDEPGICNLSRASSSGPWAQKKWGVWTVDPDPTANMLYDGVIAALNGLALLRSQPDVDRAKVGVMGGSWGGYLTTMVAGLAGPRIAAAFSVYGCGFYDEGSVWLSDLRRLSPEAAKTWLEHLDSGRRASGMRAPYFIAAAANDWYFWPSAVTRTFAAIRSPKNLVFAPNDDHIITVPGGAVGPPKIDQRAHRTHMEILWFDYHLRGRGEPFPECAPAGSPARRGGEVEVRFTVRGPRPITSAGVCYSDGEMPWRTRWWAQVEAQPIGNGEYRALLPVEEPDQPLDWYGLVTDERNVTVSTLIQTLRPEALGFQAADRRSHPFAEDFEASAAARRWRRVQHAPEEYNGAIRFVAAAAHEGARGLALGSRAGVACDGLRGITLKRDGARGIAFWVRSPGGTGFDVEWVAEMPNGVRSFWRNRQPDPGKEWRRLELTWADFSPSGREAPSVEMLSQFLGQLRFYTPAGAEIHLDDITVLR